MRCQRCRADVPLGVEPPALFLTLSVAFAVVGLVAVVVALSFPNGVARDVAWVLAVIGGLSAPVAWGAIWTNMIDGCSMGPDGRTLGGCECKACGHVNAIRPWSW